MTAARARLLRRAARIAIACVVGLSTPASTVADPVDPHDPRQTLTQFRIDGWQSEQGLPMDTVQALLQTRDGYLWVGTGAGLARFDGVRFTTMESPAVPQLTARPIFGLMEDSAGTLWIGHSEGAAVYRAGEFIPAFGREVTNGRRVWAFAEAQDGAVWAATEDGLVRFKDGKTRVYRMEQGLPRNRLRSIVFDRDGVLWLATTGGGLVSFANDRFKTFTPESGFPHLEVRSVLADPAGGVWAATAGGGLARVRGDVITTWTTKEGLPTDQLTALARDDQGSLWIGTWGGGIARLKEGRISSMSTEDGLGAGQIWSLHADREGSVWIGTWVGGLNRLRKRDFAVLGSPEGLSADNVRSVLHARDGVTWAATAGGGLNRIDRDGLITTIRAADGLPSDEIASLFQDRSGAIWVGTYTGGVARLTEGRIETWNTTTGGLPHVDVRALFEDRHGTIWAGTMAGLARFSNGRFVAVREKGAPPEGVTAILEDRNATLWFGTTGQGLFRYRNGSFSTLTRDDGLVSNWIMALHEDANGNLWIGTNGEGLNRLRAGRVTAIRPADGLWDGIVQTILEDHGGNFWITCNRGFFRVSRADLDAFADGRVKRVSSTGFGPGDALRSATFSGGQQPAGAVDTAGHVWLPSFRGLVIVDPVRLPGASGPPTVSLEDVVVNGVRMRARGSVVLPPGSVPLSISYRAMTLVGVQRVRFRYHLEGTSAGWFDAGRSREASFPALPHGEYRFRVAASVDGRNWREAPTSLAITVRPHFYETRWFLALAILAVLAIPAVIWHLRTRHLVRRHAEMERLVAERTEDLRIANEHLRRLSFVDAVTGVANRRRFDEALKQEWNRAARQGTSLAVIMADVDRFKGYNDALGHPEGDRCLAAIANVLTSTVTRAGELVARYGGEEFVVLLPSTDRAAATALAERLRRACEALAIPNPVFSPAPFVTISLGVAAAVPAPDGTGSDALVMEADAALYLAKKLGRNRVETQQPVHETDGTGPTFAEPA